MVRIYIYIFRFDGDESDNVFLGRIWKVFDLVILPKILPNSMIQKFVNPIFRFRPSTSSRVFFFFSCVIHIPKCYLILLSSLASLIVAELFYLILNLS